ncbi:MAG: tetratricopeptide repeat protein [Alphaproteobacteria bacterium]|nr:tetratricopeptide repeat protein [Alphaproteobacteria bacterium]
MKKTQEGDERTSVENRQMQVNPKYGAYLAGRVAHLRRDFNTAADFYEKNLEVTPENKDLVSKIYIILASEGRISEAAHYAKKSIQNGDNNNFTYIIVAVDEMKKNQYEEAVLSVNNLKGQVYEEFINPLLISWAYVGQNNKEQALKSLDNLSRDQSFKALYNFHAGMINDYFDDVEAAKKNYEVIVDETSLEMSFRTLQIITNFYIRNGEKDKAIALVEKYYDEKQLVDMLKRLSLEVKNANPEKTKRIISNANQGLAEALLNITTVVRQGPAGIDLAHVFICLSIYSNNNYDLAKLLLADILEGRGMYGSANAVYEQIDRNSLSYYTAQLKKSNNYTLNEEYQKSAQILKDLVRDNPNDYNALLGLADTYRMLKDYPQAIKYYNEAIHSLSEINNDSWTAFYALGVAYDQNGNWQEAEENLKKAIELSQNHYLVLNYLGYSWIERGKNVEEAFSMVVDAYMQAPNDGHIVDSLGWAFYRLGRYDEAAKYMEKACEFEPGNALINEHLGDAYYRVGRKNEAKFQWQHALVLKDDIEEVDVKAVNQKIIEGMTLDKKIPTYDAHFIEEKSEVLETVE